MALSTRTVPQGQEQLFDQYWADVLSWFDTNYRCSERSDLPDLGWMKAVNAAGTHAVAIVWESRFGGIAHGAVVVRMDGRILWLLAKPDNFTVVAEILTDWAATATGTTPWGVVERADVLALFLAGSFALDTTHPQYSEGTVIRWAG